MNLCLDSHQQRLFFPGAHGVDVKEEDVEDLLDENGTDSPPSSGKSDSPPKSDPPPSSGKSDPPPSSGKSDSPPSSGKSYTPPSSGKSDPPPSSDKPDPPPCLGSSEKHLRIRVTADKLYKRNAESMQAKYSKSKRKKIMTFSVGNTVSVKVPRIDRTSTDLHRLIRIVVECRGSEHFLYRLRYV